MFWNLWKYEIKCSYRSHALMYGILLVSSFLISPSSNFMSGIMMLIYMSMIFVTLIMTIVLIIRNYNQSMFQKAGYLTMSLPVSSKKLMAVKIINASIWLILSYAVIILSALVLGGRITGMNVSVIGEVVGEMYSMLNINTLLLILNLTLSLVSTTALIYAIMNFTHSCYVRKHRGIIAIAIFVAFNILFSFIVEYVFGGVGAQIGMGSLFSMNVSSTTVGMDIDYQMLMYISIIENIAIILACYFGASYLLDKKLEIE